MPVRTYIPGAVSVAKVAHRYLTRYEEKLRPNLGEEEKTCLTALILALAEFLACVITANPNP